MEGSYTTKRLKTASQKVPFSDAGGKYDTSVGLSIVNSFLVGSWSIRDHSAL